MEFKIPKDPFILLGFINLKLRDECDSMEVLLERYQIQQHELDQQLNIIGFYYDLTTNQYK